MSNKYKLSRPISVEEDDRDFLVDIHYNDKQIAKDIPGRRWDGERRRWTWRRNQENYDRLTSVFKDIAAKFEITCSDFRDPEQIDQQYSRAIDSAGEEYNSGLPPEGDSNSNVLNEINNKIDFLIALGEENLPLRGLGKASGDIRDEVSRVDLANSGESSCNTVEEYFFSCIFSDDSFNEIAQNKNKSISFDDFPVQKFHNAIRDKIREFDNAGDEKIIKTLRARFKKKNQEYRESGHINLVDLIWYAEEQKHYETSNDVDTYQVLHMLNKTRHVLVKNNNCSAQLRRTYLLLYISLSRIAWLRINEA